LAAWLGILQASWQFGLLLLFLFMVGYLSTRGIKTLRWYRERFPTLPPHIKVLVPFVL